MPFAAILREVDQLHNVSTRLEGLAEQHAPMSEALLTIAGNVRNTATVLAVLVVAKGPKPIWSTAGISPESPPLDIGTSYPVDAVLSKKGRFMNAIISIGMLLVLFTTVLLHWMRRPELQLAGSQSQRMCRSCGLITSRSKPRCLECGKPLSGLYSTSKKWTASLFRFYPKGHQKWRPSNLL
jgi:hypothetical protein